MTEIVELERRIAEADIKESISLRLELAYKTRLTDPKASMQHALKAYQDACNLNEPDEELRALNAICTAYLYDDEIQDKNKWIDLLIQRGIELDNNAAVGRAYFYLYRWNIRSENLTEAAQYLNKALEFFDPQQHSGEVVSCYNGLGNVHFKLKSYDKALEYYNLALPLVPPASQYYPFNILQNIGSIHVIKKEYELAWKVYNDILSRLPNSEIDTKYLVLQNLGHLCQRTDKLTQAVDFFQQALEIKLEAGIKRDIIRSLCNLAMAYLSLKDYAQSLEKLQQAEKLVLETEDLSNQIEVYQCFVEYYKSSHNLQNQVSYYEKLLAAMLELHQSDSLNKINEFEIHHQINLYKEKSQLLNQKNLLISQQNQNLKSSADELVSRNKNLEIRLKNAFSTIKKKDDLLTAHHRLASIGEMIAIIAHQWQQPLSIINAVVYSIKDAYYYEELSEAVINEKVQTIDDLINYLSQTLNDFRNFFKEQDYKDFYISASVKSALSLLEYALKLENISIETDFHNDFILAGSQNELTQVFLNLINNARDAIKEENIPHPQLKITLVKDHDFNLISFYNNGGPVPVPDNIAQHIFDAYISSKGEKGTGLGLNICKTIIEERFHGNIWFENTIEGVFFHIKFPVQNT